MLAGGFDGLYRAILEASPHYTTRLEVWRGGVRVDDYGDRGLPISAGNMTATLRSRVTRQLSFTTDESLYPNNVTDLLAPYGTFIKAFMTVGSGATAPYQFPIFVGRINTPAQPAATIVDCVDRAADVVDAGFFVPENSNTGDPVLDEFHRLVIQGVPDATFGTNDAIYTSTPKLTWESDRAGACDDLADASGAFWYTLGNGDFVFRLIPWTVSGVSVVNYSDGPAGTVTDAVPTRSREQVYNAITVVGERADGTRPVYATAVDDNPASLTYVNGPYGVKGRQIRAQGVSDQGQAMVVARAALRAAKAMTEAWTVQMVPDPALELGDVATITAKGRTVTQVLTSLSMSLISDTPMSTVWRALIPGSGILEA